MTVPTTDARDYLEAWLNERRITEVECQVPDLAGISRGKILPAKKFINTLRDRGLRIPESIFIQTVTAAPMTAMSIRPIAMYLTPGRQRCAWCLGTMSQPPRSSTTALTLMGAWSTSPPARFFSGSLASIATSGLRPL